MVKFLSSKEISTQVPILNNPSKLVGKITRFWDNLSEPWQNIWGQHIHHGYYNETEVDALKSASYSMLKPEEKLIQKICDNLKIKTDDHILDVGCGLGGSAIYLAEHYPVNVLGITLSSKQKKLAEKRISEKKISKVSIRLDDAHTLNTVADNSCDIVWALESCEQFYDKELFIKTAFRVLKTNGQLMIATWCADKPYLKGIEAKNYIKLCKAYDLPYMPTKEYYRNCLTQYFKEVEVYDWSLQVQNSWKIAIDHLKKYNTFQLLRMTGWKGLQFMRYLPLMSQAFLTQKIRYGLFIATKI